MALGKKPPPNVEFPPELVCKWCDRPRPNHCTRHIKNKDGVVVEYRNPKCGWYPCNACKVVSVLGGLHLHEGSWKWSVTYRKVDPKFFLS